MASRRFLSAAARPLVVASLLSAPMLVMAGPARADTSGSSTAAAATTTTTPLLPGLSTTTTTTAPAHSTTTSTSTTSSTTSTTVSKGPGVPPVPVGGPPTTTTTAPAGSPSTTAPPQPSVEPIVAQVDVDLDQLSAIGTYKPAQALVAKAQSKVTEAGATLLSDRQSLQRATGAAAKATQAKSTADSKLRTLALAAYMGVGYSIPGSGSDASPGSSPANTTGGLTGMDAVDAQEMLVVVGQHARQADNGAARTLVQATNSVKAATNLYKHDQNVVNASEAQLLAAQQTLKLVTTAAITPGAAAATPLSDLMSYIQSGGQKQPPATTTTTSSTTVAPSSTSSTVTGTLTPALQEATADIPNPVAPAIMGKPQLNADQLLAWWNTLNRKPNITVPIKDLIGSYAKWGARLGVRYDVAFAQSIVETGSFSFPSFGQLTDKDNNFAGIGACDTCAKGWSFPSADTGVLAQLELLREYATNDPLPKGIPNVIGGTGVGGCCQSWTQLAGKWASSTVYGISIMTVYQQELAWLIPQNEVSAGLIAPTSPAAKGPDLAPLPGSKPPPNQAANKAAAGAGKTSGPTTTSTTVPQSVTAAGTKH